MRYLFAPHSVLAHDQWRFQNPIARAQDRDGADKVGGRKTERRAEGVSTNRSAGYSRMMPPRAAIVTASVRSLAPSLPLMCLT